MPTPTLSPVLISACLLGRPVRFDGRGATRPHPLIDRLQATGRLIPLCPEIAGGLPTPRPPAEIVPTGHVTDGAGGRAVIDATGADVTAAFATGAALAVETARRAGARLALLKARSPSCGAGLVYDGSFSGRLIAGHGLTAAALTAAGIIVCADDDLDRAARLLAELDGDNAW
ncbi:hypothetical protein GCM10011505_21280 [Tistrella bauzanensis]|uniref:DUF523 domain-containing protein n=1 Tax=Tistrella bauzanensis TaxID=657419 RepID=A0ABQ1IID0_9PROT|nr:DUF523 domain-containing protein [Tistrella bauzanensis]GGB39455.1 hypothetical protein GCM10011505_21280 [Tistrella bauzanensis]